MDKNFQLAAVAVLVLIVGIKYGNLSFTKTPISDDDVLRQSRSDFGEDVMYFLVALVVSQLYPACVSTLPLRQGQLWDMVLLKLFNNLTS